MVHRLKKENENRGHFDPLIRSCKMLESERDDF